MLNRRNFIKHAGMRTTGSLIAGSAGLKALPLSTRIPVSGQIEIDPLPLFEISPLLYKQFMEPLGSTEPSVEAPKPWAQAVI